MQWQPFLREQSVLIRPLQPMDFEALYQVAKDPLIWAQHPNPDRWQRPIFETFFEGAIQSQGALLIQQADTGEIMGTSRYYHHDVDQSLVYIGYTFFGRKFWGTGVNPLVKKKMLEHAFQWVDRVHFQIGALNIRSQIATERLGAEKVGEEWVEYYGESPKMNFIYEITKQNSFLKP